MSEDIDSPSQAEKIDDAIKPLKATHEGPIVIGTVTLNSAVLEDGTRVLSRIGLLRAIGRTGKAKGGAKYEVDAESKLPLFVAADNLRPFIPGELRENTKPVRYLSKGGTVNIGYRADALPSICEVFLEARYANKLLASQKHIAEQCRILSKGFAVVGINALVDEATGYQEVRDKQALREILDLYLKKEFAAWAKRFPEEFYIQMFRLRGWTWKGMRVNRPSVVGRWTNDLVYGRLAPGLVKELESRNPKADNGQRKTKHHQWLTDDVGHPALAQHLHAVIGFMRAASSWGEFYRMVQRAFPKIGETQHIQFDVDDK